MSEKHKLVPAGQLPVAYAVFADNGNIRIWKADLIQAEALRMAYGDQVRPLYATPQPAPDVTILVETLESIAEYWNQDSNEGAMRDACEYAQSAALAALAAYRKQGGDE